MTVFADTSAFFALLVQDDCMHNRARMNFEHFVQNDSRLLTSSYVLLSFEIMEAREIITAFAFDRHFTERGFEIAAFHDLDTAN